jgi:hypothetical protein
VKGAATSELLTFTSSSSTPPGPNPKNSSGPAKFLGLPATEGYAIVIGLVVVVLLAVVAVGLLRRRKGPPASGSAPPPGVQGPPPST